MIFFKTMFRDVKLMVIFFLCFIIGILSAKYHELYKQNHDNYISNKVILSKYDSLKANYDFDINKKDSLINNYVSIISEQSQILNSIIKEKSKKGIIEWN